MGRRSVSLALIATLLALAVVLLPGCKRAPEEVAPPEQVVPTEQDQPPITALELPQNNPEIAITLNSVPPGLAATLNTSYWIELTDIRNQSIQYAFVGNPSGQPGPAASSTAEFEVRVLESPNGRITERGTLETIFGPAQWVSGIYDDDYGPVEDIHVFVPHPSGTGTVVMTAICPTGAATVEERLAVIQEILTHVS